VMARSEHLYEPSAMRRFGDVVERGLEAVLEAGATLQRRRAWSKPGARVGSGGHEESTPAK
jgi:hypothetical protein